MAKRQRHNKAVSKIDTPTQAVNPFFKLMKDHEKIADAIKNDQPLSSLMDIKFVQPI